MVSQARPPLMLFLCLDQIGGLAPYLIQTTSKSLSAPRACRGGRGGGGHVESRDMKVKEDINLMSLISKSNIFRCNNLLLNTLKISQESSKVVLSQKMLNFSKPLYYSIMQTTDLPHLKRIHLFEFEDFAWFPNWIRMCMTRYINAFHALLKSHENIASLIKETLPHAQEQVVLDMCSGSGGPMPQVLELLKQDENFSQVKLELSDLYPNLAAAKQFNSAEKDIYYHPAPVDATQVDPTFKGMRTMIASMHHMPPQVAVNILADAQKHRQPILIYEISDNAPPIWLWWLAIPFAFIATLFITPLVRPMTWQQLVFTYLIPILPLFIAWDGAVSNARTYTLSDWDKLLSQLPENSTYKWEKNTLEGKVGNKTYLKGFPV